MTHDSEPRALGRSQLELPGGAAPPEGAADPDRMRTLLEGLLAEARAARAMPWPPLNARLYRMLFPQLAVWLPQDEGARLRREFEAELARLEAA